MRRYKSEKKLNKSLKLECMNKSYLDHSIELEESQKDYILLKETNLKLLPKLKKQEGKIKILKDQSITLLDHIESEGNQSKELADNNKIELLELRIDHFKDFLAIKESEINMLKMELDIKDKIIHDHVSTHQNLSEKLNDMKIQTDRITEKNITLQKLLNRSYKLNNMLDGSSSGKKKFGLGFELKTTVKNPNSA